MALLKKEGGGGSGGLFGFLGAVVGAVLPSIIGGGAGPATAAQGTSVTGTSTMASFAHGGQFTVGGSGATDSNVVQFRATRGEQVTITPPGRGGGTPEIVVNQTNNFSLDAVNVQQQIEAAAPRIAAMAKAGVADAVMRGGRFKRALA